MPFRDVMYTAWFLLYHKFCAYSLYSKIRHQMSGTTMHKIVQRCTLDIDLPPCIRPRSLKYNRVILSRPILAHVHGYRLDLKTGHGISLIFQALSVLHGTKV